MITSPTFNPIFLNILVGVSRKTLNPTILPSFKTSLIAISFHILSKLDVMLDGEIAHIKKLSECHSVNSIYKLLKKHKLLK